MLNRFRCSFVFMVALVVSAVYPAAGQGMWREAPAPSALRPNPENYRPGMKFALWLSGNPQNGGVPQGRPPVMRYSMCHEGYVFPLAYFMNFANNTGEMLMRIHKTDYVTFRCEGLVYVAKPGQYHLGVEFHTGSLSTPEIADAMLSAAISAAINADTYGYTMPQYPAGARLDVYMTDKPALHFPWQNTSTILTREKLLQFSHAGYYPMTFILVMDGRTADPSFRVSFRHVDDEGLNYFGADGFFLPGTAGATSTAPAPSEDEEALLID